MRKEANLVTHFLEISSTFSAFFMVSHTYYLPSIPTSREPLPCFTYALSLGAAHPKFKEFDHIWFFHFPCPVTACCFTIWSPFYMGSVCIISRTQAEILKTSTMIYKSVYAIEVLIFRIINNRNQKVIGKQMNSELWRFWEAYLRLYKIIYVNECFKH